MEYSGLGFRAGTDNYLFGNAILIREKFLEDEKLYIKILNKSGEHLATYAMQDVLKYLNDESWALIP